MRKVLLTGCAGFVGSNFIPILLEKYEIIGTDSFEKNGKRENIKEFLNHPNFTFIEQNLEENFNKTLKEEISKVDVIFNLASMSSVEDSIHDPSTTVLNNVKLMLNLLDNCKDKKIIHLSSDEVYGESINYAHGENYIYAPSNPYAASKAMQENLLFSYWRTYNSKIIICNTINLLGIKQTDNKFIPLLVKKIMQDEEIDIYMVKRKIGSRIYMDVRNIADAFIFIDENIEQNNFLYQNRKEKPLKINIVDEREKKISNINMTRKISLILDKHFNYNLKEITESEIRPGYDRMYKIKGNFLKKMGWQPKYQTKDSLEEIINWYRKKYSEYEI